MSKGRRTKCTPELTKKIAELLRAGNFVDTACEVAGLGKSTYHSWCQRARDELSRIENTKGGRVRKREQPYVDFLGSCTRALAEAESTAVGKVRDKANDGNLDALKWYLERRYPDRWGKRVHDVKVDAPAAFVFLPAEDEEEDDG